ncbi:MAG: Fic family protein [Atopobiaceae bacterium]|nr:Fic family protein [Atopobiaceae bacterium]
MPGCWGERAFTLSPFELCDIHRRLFDQVLPRAGKYRNYNVTKKEWVLKGETVYYATCGTIEETLRYDFTQERNYSYAGLSGIDIAHHVAKFVSEVWQIHPFGEGNTRTTAVFAIKYLRSMGYRVDNEPFKNHSWYFRNALVRANYEDVTQGVSPEMVYLERFFENLLCGVRHELRNRYLHLDWPQKQISQEVESALQVTDQVTDQVRALLNVLGDGELSAMELMNLLGLSHRHTFRQHYLNPALEAGLIECTIPDKPTSRLQKYRKTGR